MLPSTCTAGSTIFLIIIVSNSADILYRASPKESVINPVPPIRLSLAASVRVSAWWSCVIGNTLASSVAHSKTRVSLSANSRMNTQYLKSYFKLLTHNELRSDPIIVLQKTVFAERQDNEVGRRMRWHRMFLLHALQIESYQPVI